MSSGLVKHEPAWLDPASDPGDGRPFQGPLT